MLHEPLPPLPAIGTEAGLYRKAFHRSLWRSGLQVWPLFWRKDDTELKPPKMSKLEYRAL